MVQAVDQAEADAVNAMVDVRPTADSFVPKASSVSEPHLGETPSDSTSGGKKEIRADGTPAVDASTSASFGPAETRASDMTVKSAETSRNAEQASNQQIADDLTASSTDASMITARSTPPPDVSKTLPIPPPAASGTLPSENENFSAALERSSTRTREKKEPALLGEFVSLDDMEGRSHLRFASKSPEVSPFANWTYFVSLILRWE